MDFHVSVLEALYSLTVRRSGTSAHIPWLGSPQQESECAVSKDKGHERSREYGLSLYAPVIVKYRDDKTDLSTAPEELLR
jgi:2,3,4,5-tetrahydropyridine-2-carboxylate N-succinyltransferase